MPLFSTQQLYAPISSEDAWNHIVAVGNKRPHDNLLISSYELKEEEKIVWLEKLRHVALGHAKDLSLLEPYKDFQEYALERRPDPTRGEWLWLYSQIGERHDNLSIQEIVEIMMNRDAFLPFFDSVPDGKLWTWFHEWPEPDEMPGESAIPYQGLEAAIQEDAPGVVAITKMMCRNVTDAEILNRAIALGKSAVVASMFPNVPMGQLLDLLFKAHASWENPAPLLNRVLQLREDDIAAWRDPWGNGFFWHLYRRPVLSMDIIRGLPPKVLATFETKNRYGISPKDLWDDYRPTQN